MKLIINGEEYDSLDEYYFACWLRDLKLNGFVEDYKRNFEPIPITPGVVNEYLVDTVMKTRTKTEKKIQTILKPSVYTPDFLIRWRERAEGIFFQRLDEGKKIITPFIAQDSLTTPNSHVECKPLYDQNNMERLFKNNQKYIFDKYQIYINLTYPVLLFKDTFVPHEYLKTATGKPRKFTQKLLTIEEYIYNISKY